MGIMDNAVVNYDMLAERMSVLLNRLIYTEYLLFTLKTRTEASSFDGFTTYFNRESNIAHCMINGMTRQIIDSDNSIDFLQIDAVPTKGSKVYDLLIIYEECLNKNIAIGKEMLEFVNKQTEYRICSSDMLDNFIYMNTDMLNRAVKIRKKLSNAINNYEVLLLIDKQLGDKYND